MNTVSEVFPSQIGKAAVVTGASDGIGFEVALALARAGAYVLATDCDDEKGIESVHRIRECVPTAEIEYDRLDVASFASVREFSERTARRFPAIDLLVNNAEIAGPRKRSVTRDGFEAIFATNYLGHFALTRNLLPLLLRDSGRAREPSRVVHVSAIAHRIGRIHFEDLQGERSYRPNRAYAQSKLALLLFSLELDRRLRAVGAPLASMVAHPDVASVLYAAVSPAAESGGFYGPRGSPTPARIGANARDRETALRLWEISEQWIGGRFFRTKPGGFQVELDLKSQRPRGAPSGTSFATQ
jgi:NAD(P)-dependent dehydrogenase (short-subunit alcohol dehydrogenase family)